MFLLRSGHKSIRLRIGDSVGEDYIELSLREIGCLGRRKLVHCRMFDLYSRIEDEMALPKYPQELLDCFPSFSCVSVLFRAGKIRGIAAWSIMDSWPESSRVRVVINIFLCQ